MKKIIGIDLGTTTSGVSIVEQGKVTLIEDSNGNKLTDSVVSINQFGDIIVGNEAKNSLRDKVIEVKRKMGTHNTFSLGDKEYLPEEISAEILKKMKVIAENYIGENIDEAIITVPAQFNSFQKMATLKAGELAGLKIERIVTEPTAAALAYGIDKLENEEKILVYDFGGGTFDVSILDFEYGIMDVIAGDGDNFLGGKNIDDLLIKHVCHIENINIKDDYKIKNLLKNAVEQAKVDLSKLNEARIIVPELKINLSITKKEFEEMIDVFVEKTFVCIDNALKNANLTDEEIKVVLPVGGTSNIPYIQNKLIDRFGDKVFIFDNLQEIVAIGAGIQGGIKSGEISHETGIMLTDICSHNLGIACMGEYQGIMMPGMFSPILKKHSPLPAKGKNIYYTIKDSQSEVTMQIYEGNGELSKENIFIGEMEIVDLPSLPAGQCQIEVEFDYDLNGILKVNAKILNNEIVFNGEFQPHQRLQGMNNNDNNNIGHTNSKYYDDFKVTIDLAERKLKNVEKDKKDNIESLLIKLKEELINENLENLNKIDDKLTDILFSI